MEVDLPTGCNIMQNNYSFYNYSNGDRTRRLYVIYEGVAHMSREETSQYPYTYTGDCVIDGDLIYRPSDVVFFDGMSVAFCLFIGVVLFNLIVRRLRWNA